MGGNYRIDHFYYKFSNLLYLLKNKQIMKKISLIFIFCTIAGITQCQKVKDCTGNVIGTYNGTFYKNASGKSVYYTKKYITPKQTIIHYNTNTGTHIGTSYYNNNNMVTYKDGTGRVNGTSSRYNNITTYKDRTGKIISTTIDYGTHIVVKDPSGKIIHTIHK